MAAALVGAALAKVTGLLAFAWPLLALAAARGRGRAVRAVAAAIAAAGLVLAAPLAYFLRHSGEVDDKSGMLQGRAGDVLGNAATAARWLLVYGTVGILGLALLGAIVAVAGWRRERVGLVALAGVLLPCAFFVVVSRSLWAPRYLLVAVVPLCALAGIGARTAAARLAAPLRSARAAVALAAAVLVIPAVRLDTRILADPPAAALPAEDRGAFVFDWPSGYGTTEVARFLEAARRDAPAGIAVALHSQADHTVELGLRAAFLSAADVAFVSADLDRRSERERVRAWAGPRPLFLVLGVPDAGTVRRPPAAFALPVLVAVKPGGAYVAEVFRAGAPAP